MTANIIEQNGETIITSSNVHDLDIDNLIEKENEITTTIISNDIKIKTNIVINFEFKINNKKQIVTSGLLKVINDGNKTIFTIIVSSSEAVKLLDILYTNIGIEVNSIIIKSDEYKTKLSKDATSKIVNFSIKKKKKTNKCICVIEIDKNK